MKKHIVFLLILSAIALSYGVSLREKIGQMIMVSCYQYSNFMDTLRTDINERNLGGFLLFKRNISNPEQIQEFTSQLQQDADIPLFILVDQEGGYVARLDEANGFEDTYSAYQLGSVFNNEDSTRNTAAKMGQWLSNSGINTNLAPVVDVNVNPSSPAIGAHERSFSEYPQLVYQHASWFIEEFHNQNIITTLKHFPGHGSAEEDSHLGFTDITTTWADSELIPYTKLISEGFSDIIMVGHLYNANIDSLYPASLSLSTITHLLKDSLHYNGLIMSDEMLMGAITNQYNIGEAAELAINAGIDILLYRTNELNNKSLVRQVVDMIEEKVNSGQIAESRIDESYEKIISLKDNIDFIEPHIYYSQIPEEYTLYNYPNPFNSKTIIIYRLPVNTDVTLSIYNMLGQKVAILVNKKQPAGNYKVEWDATGFASGIYLNRMNTIKGYSKTQKLILIK